jgi:hypothetical protein
MCINKYQRVDSAILKTPPKIFFRLYGIKNGRQKVNVHCLTSQDSYLQLFLFSQIHITRETQTQ